jgi:YggT family protein
MAEYRETVTDKENETLDEDGGVVREKTRQVSTDSSADAKTTAQNIIYYILGFILVLLAIRFVLKLLGANTASGFVDFIYGVSGIFTAPFDNIFGVTTAAAGETRSVFEPSIIVAALVYVLIAWGAARLLTLNSRR